MGIILSIGLIAFLIVFLSLQRKVKRDLSLKSKYKNSARIAFAFGILCFFSALSIWYFWLQGSIHFKSHSFTKSPIFYVAYSYFGIKGVVGLLILFGIISIVTAKYLMRKSEQKFEQKKKNPSIAINQM
jgi:magnesium-transporting ATPase (P-type)